jgi:hypothetical protein
MYLHNPIISIFMLIVQSCIETMQNLFRKRSYVYFYNKKGWMKGYPLRPVRWVNLVMPRELIDTLVEDIHTFLHSRTIRTFIRTFDMPLKKTLLVEGADGSSKMELVHMLATTYNKDIYDFSDITNINDLRAAIRCVRRCGGFMLYRGDFKMTPIQATFCKLLSEMDWKSPIVCFLVNDFNSYKSKSLPEHGVDYEVYIPPLDEEQLRQIYRRMLGGDDDSEEELFVQKLLSARTNVTYVRQWLIRVAPRILGKGERVVDLFDDLAKYE